MSSASTQPKALMVVWLNGAISDLPASAHGARQTEEKRPSVLRDIFAPQRT